MTPSDPNQIHDALEREIIRPKPLHAFSRRIWEPITVGAMFLGFVMLLQPFFLVLFTHAFSVILFGVIGFTVASKLPE